MPWNVVFSLLISLNSFLCLFRGNPCMDEKFHFTGMTGFSPAFFLSYTVSSSRMSANTILPLSTSIKHNPDNKTKSALSLTFVKITPFFFWIPHNALFLPSKFCIYYRFSMLLGKAAYCQQYLRTKSYANLGVKSVLWSIRTDSQQGGTKTGNGRMKNGNKTSLEPSPYQ